MTAVSQLIIVFSFISLKVYLVLNSISSFFFFNERGRTALFLCQAKREKLASTSRVVPPKFNLLILGFS